MNYKKLSYTYNNKLKRSPQRLHKWKSTTPASDATEGESYKYGTWEINHEHHSWIARHDCEQKLAPESVTAIKARHPIPTGGYFKSLEINKTIRPSQQAVKEDKQLAEAEQQILDLRRIAIHIEELARGLEGIQNPSKPEVIGFAQEITGSAQDLLRLAFNYSSKIKHTRRTAFATTSGYDRDTTTSAPESEFSETQYLFHPEVLSRMEEHRSKSRNDKLLRIAISGKIPNGFQRPGNQSYQNNRGGYFRGGHANRGGYRGAPNQYNQSYRPPSYTNNQQRQGPKQSTGQSSFTDHPTGLRDIRKSVSDDTGDDHGTGKILSKNWNVGTSIGREIEEKNLQKNFSKVNFYVRRHNCQQETAGPCQTMVGYNNGTQNKGKHHPYCRSGQHPCRLAVKERSQAMGMGAFEKAIQQDQQALGPSEDRPVRIGTEQETPAVLLTGTGPTITGDRCTIAFMAQEGGICQPTTDASTANTTTSDTRTATDGNSSAQLALTALVSSATETSTGTTHGAEIRSPSMDNASMVRIGKNEQGLTKEAIQLISES
ncbi:hypothetical protein BB560_006737, partial [Smittium megazygosporum]